jgi:outer membrane protein assembly factor BamE
MRKVLASIALALLVAGCQYVPTIPFLGPHKIDIQQGNYVTQEMVDKLKRGMTRSQVRFALGTPLITDPFHADRWDYIYVYETKGRLFAKRHIVAVFKGDALVGIEGDVVPQGFAAEPAPVAPPNSADAPSSPTVTSGDAAR